MGASSSFRPAGFLESAPLAAYSGPWNQRLAAHLMRRAGFGASPSDIEKAAKRSMHENVDALIEFPPTDLPNAPPGNLPDPFTVTAPDNASTMLFQKLREQQVNFLLQANAKAQLWWLDRMLKTPAPLQEKMTLFWHGHFTSEMGTKFIRPYEGINQNNLYRRYALGNIRDLTQEVSRDPAMLKYLDNGRSRKEHPNENYARELMELFTLGIGNYTERDVRESARAFTGWIVRQVDAGPIQANAGFFKDSSLHDFETKKFLGHTGNLDGNDIVDIIFQQPAAAHWFARKLLRFFVYEDPEPELIEALAALIKKHDFTLKPVMSTLLRSKVFYSERSYRALVKSPVEFAIGSYKLCGIREVEPETPDFLARMGQILFHPPGVKGWDGGAAWLNSQTLLTRENFVSSLMTSKPMMKGESPILEDMPLQARRAAARLVNRILQGDASATALGTLAAYLDGSNTPALGMLSKENFEERVRGATYLTMAMPAYQLN